jgi:hypothetical protein
MDKVSEYLISMITKQVENSGLVVWYDPEKNYTNVINELTIPETTILRFENSFFKLRSEIEPLLEFINKDNKPRHDCGVPPRLLIYVPKSRNETHYALIEAEAAGVVLEPGAHPWVRNTRLRVIAEQVFKKLAPDSVSDICRQVDEGRLSLEELDRLSLEVEGLATGTVKIIFGTASAAEVALAFAASTQYDEGIQAKQALPELAGLFRAELGIEIETDNEPDLARKTLLRILLVTDLIASLPEKDRPKMFSSLPLPLTPDKVEKVRHICQVWRNRSDLKEAYVSGSKAVEIEIGLKGQDLPVELLADSDTFSSIEQKLLLSAEQSILQGKPDEGLQLAESRKNSFWSLQEPMLQLRWTLLENSARILICGKNMRPTLATKDSPDGMVLKYTEGANPWHSIDTCYRHLENQYSSFDLELGGEHDELEKVIVYVRQDYTKTVEQSIEAFIAALESSNFSIKGYLSQTDIYSKYVEPPLRRSKKIAYLLVDALRYEMGKELVEGLVDDFEVTLLPCIAQLPTITAVGMAALLPQTEKGLHLIETPASKVAVGVGTAVVKDRPGRLKYFEESLKKKIIICKLNDLIKPSKKRQAEIQTSEIVLVTSQEIDRLGEEPDGEDEARLFMEEMLDKLRKGIRRLASLGVGTLVVTADHGHLFGETSDSGMKMDPPGGKTLELHRRVWIGKGGKAADGYIRVSVGRLGLGGDFECAFPKTLACFKTKGGSMAYFHGGISLQEMVIPVILLEAKKTKSYAPEMAGVKLSMEKAKITTRFFSVTATYYAQGLLGSEEIRVKIIVKTDRKDVGSAVMSVYGFEEGTKEIVLVRNKPNPITIMLTDTQDLKDVSVHVLDAISQVEFARLEHIPVQISI